MDENLETTYVPETEEIARREEEQRIVQEGTDLWRSRKEELLRQKQQEQCELRRMLANYSPWGKPGGGAPCATTLRKRNVPLEPPEPLKCPDIPQGWTSKSITHRLQEGDDINSGSNNRTNKYFDDVKRNVMPNSLPGPLPEEDPRKSFNEEVQVYRLTGGVELVPLLTSRRYQSHPPSTRHIATDATRPGYMIDTFRALNVGNKEYVSALSEQIRRKQEKALEDRRWELENCRRHFDTWRRFWGRPGHGAPIDHVHRNNLYNILYRPVVY